MCGIAAIIQRTTTIDTAAGQKRAEHLTEMLARIKTRGDAENFAEIATGPGYALGTNRLAIVDRAHGRQPLRDASGDVSVVFNGEIYNYLALRAELETQGYVFATHSDTEVLLHGYQHWGDALCQRLDGMFAFVVVDARHGRLLAARDHIGIKPIYYAQEEDRWLFASEQKSILPWSKNVQTVLPGTFVRETGAVTRYFDLGAAPRTAHNGAITQLSGALRELLATAVKNHVQTDLPIAVMFSGGIDSTVVLHFARQYHHDVTAVTVGLEGAADIDVARRYCAEHDVRHVVRHFTEEELIRRVPAAVRGGEFFEAIDVIDTAIASFAYEAVQELGIKVALCGEGSDEILAGYDLFRKHPHPVALTEYRVGNLHRTDLQRVDRAAMMHSVEARVPFLDRDVLRFAYGLPLNVKLRDGIEKWILREAVRDLLPAYIADRPKVRMPDGSGVKNVLIAHAEREAARRPLALDAPLFDTPQARFFLAQYLEAGFPLPTERHRRKGFDYSETGYFEFVS
jgi:asparagine synthase (glutamine-hydrolysing)